MTLPRFTQNNIDLSRKNNLNITSVENEYDAAMRASGEMEPWQDLLALVNRQEWHTAQNLLEKMTEAEKEAARANFRRLSTVHIPLFDRAARKLCGFEA